VLVERQFRKERRRKRKKEREEEKKEREKREGKDSNFKYFCPNLVRRPTPLLNLPQKITGARGGTRMHPTQAKNEVSSTSSTEV